MAMPTPASLALNLALARDIPINHSLDRSNFPGGLPARRSSE